MKAIPVRHITSSETGQHVTGKFSIRSLQQVLNGKDLVHPLHRHDFFFVLALQQGKGVHEIDFTRYKLHDHVIFMLRPGQVHKLELKAGSRGYIMEFDLSFYQPKKTITEHRWKKASAKNYCEVAERKFMKLNGYLSDLFNEYSTKADGYTEAIKANLDLFFIEYTRLSSNASFVAPADNNYTQERFEAFMLLLETKIHSLKNVSQYAQLLNLSAYQLNAITKRSAGKTVSDLINDQIILEAKRLLLATASQVKDIAGQLGYEDVSYFTRFFKKHTGMPPELFRKNFK